MAAKKLKGKPSGEDLEAVREILASLPERESLSERIFSVIQETPAVRGCVDAIVKKPPLAEESEAGLLDQVSAGGGAAEGARARLNEGYLPLVVWIAKDYCEAEVSFLDLLNEGTVGLMNAVGDYSPDGGLSFREHAALAIKDAISCAVAAETRSSRVPSYILEKINSVRSVSQKLAEEKGGEPSRAEIAAAIGLTADELERLIGLAKVKPQQEEEEPEEEAEEAPDEITDSDDYY
ncbi:MAG: hypothetical protein KC777_28035 [Cyanobacteria bacterium HKST-UBA02]|nr:hypothetical protein [Cyanobacteria bacterium HKST-UBA02]